MIIELDKNDYIIKFNGNIVKPISVKRNEGDNTWVVELPKELLNDNGRIGLRPIIEFNCNHEFEAISMERNGSPFSHDCFDYTFQCVKCGYRP